MPSSSIRAISHLVRSDRREWKKRAHWYSGWEYAVGLLIGAALGFGTVDSPESIVLFATGGLVGGPLLLWGFTLGYVYNHSEKRFDTHLENHAPGVAFTHGVTRPVGEQPIGDPWWQIVYPDGNPGEWFQRDEHAGLPVRGAPSGGYNLRFDRRGQEGSFTVLFRGSIREGDPPVPLDDGRWHFTEQAGWDRA